jgi:hypothetical protein
LVRIAVKQALSILDCGKIIFAHKSNLRRGDVVVRCEVANPIFGHRSPPSLGNATAVPRQLADNVCPKLRSALRRGLGERFDRHSQDYRIDHYRVRFDIRLLGNWVGAIHVTAIRETCGSSTNQREAPRCSRSRTSGPSSPRVAVSGGSEVSVLLTRLYAPSGDFAGPAYAARTSHWAAFMKRGVGRRGCITGLGDCGDNVNWTPLHRAVPSRARSRAATRTAPAASASAPQNGPRLFEENQDAATESIPFPR